MGTRNDGPPDGPGSQPPLSAGQAALWSDVARHVNDNRDGADVEAEIMRLAARPDLLNRYLNRPQAGESGSPPVAVFRWLAGPPVFQRGPGVTDPPHRQGLSDSRWPAGEPDASSLMPQWFEPTPDDRSRAIPAEPESESGRASGISVVIARILGWFAGLLQGRSPDT